MLKVFPEGVEPQNLSDTLCIVMAMLQESKGDFGDNTPDDFMKRPNLEDAELLLTKINEVKKLTKLDDNTF